MSSSPEGREELPFAPVPEHFLSKAEAAVGRVFIFAGNRPKPTFSWARLSNHVTLKLRQTECDKFLCATYSWEVGYWAIQKREGLGASLVLLHGSSLYFSFHSPLAKFTHPKAFETGHKKKEIKNRWRYRKWMGGQLTGYNYLKLIRLGFKDPFTIHSTYWNKCFPTFHDHVTHE